MAVMIARAGLGYLLLTLALTQPVVAQSPRPAPQITPAWLVGSWGPLPNGGNPRASCDADSTVTFYRNGKFEDGGSEGRFRTDGKSITYFGRVFFEEAEETKLRAELRRPLTTRVRAINRNTLREDNAMLYRCQP